MRESEGESERSREGETEREENTHPVCEGERTGVFLSS